MVLAPAVTGLTEDMMNILLAIDDSPCSAAATRAVIDQFVPAHTRVHLLHADDWPQGMPPAMAFAEGPAAAQSVLGLHRLRRTNAAALLESTSDELRHAGFVTAASLREGDPTETIVACAKEWHTDLIVLGSHGKKGVERMLGSVSNAVARHAPCSVEIVRSAN
jgi:nucleotide-binding universal stress UspA family protein